jgi:peptidoglycan lytic transglycosylase F
LIIKFLVPLVSRLLFIFSVCLILSSCDLGSFTPKKLSQLEKIKRDGTLTVLTRYDPTTYYEGAEGYTGFEYDLVMLFAEQLHVKVNFIVPKTFEEILTRISRGDADIAAAGLTITENRKQKMRFAPYYDEITEQIIYRSGKRRPKNGKDLTRGILEVVKGTSHIESLIHLRKQAPDLDWNVNEDLNTDGLLYLVNEGLIDYTVADSNQAQLIRRFYPKLNIAFNITKPRQLAWALSPSKDSSLYDEIVNFFDTIKKDKTLSQLIDRHYGHASSLNYVGLCKFREHVKKRLPAYQKFFQEEAEKYQIDWRLLAAIGYQESHWNKNAKSPTGVKGIMMLTKGTAKYLGIKNREDPRQSIEGGARYFIQRIKKIPERIPEPDRTWMALASYNIGFGHLEDARVLTQKRGGNPDKWMDVKKTLPLLSQKKWHSKTKHGYARGKEPVRYIENVRSYYDLLVWLTEENQIEKNAMTIKQKEKLKNAALNIDSPVL